MKFKETRDLTRICAQLRDGTLDGEVRAILEDMPTREIDEELCDNFEVKIRTLLSNYRNGVDDRKYYPTNDDSTALTILFGEAYEECSLARETKSAKHAIKGGMIIKEIEYALEILKIPIDDRLEEKEKNPETKSYDKIYGFQMIVRYNWV
ncbi:hypothetical protein HY483_02980 [Candidatus Woesearchaeota archaeon]|nr:hypothetical protein [Candidatus Woesearchaeota archaeon]